MKRNAYCIWCDEITQQEEESAWFETLPLLHCTCCGHCNPTGDPVPWLFRLFLAREDERYYAARDAFLERQEG